MGESLEVSVSFGKYENDAALSWEKWSTFSPNKYLEEVGKCSTPGSVAQKKAFFEAHYKKIAAMKAEAELLLDQDHTFQQIQEDCTQINEKEPTFDGSGSIQEEDKPFNDEDESQHLSPSQSPITLNTSAADKLEEAVLVNVESMKLVKQHFQVDLETEDPPEMKPQKINPKKVENNSLGLKKKTASTKQTSSKIPLKASRVPKSPETPATRLSKPKPKPKETSTSTLKKASTPSSSSTSKTKNQSLSETRRVSLHLSISVNSDTASSATSSRRRSLFMEQMGDKDIVKRAFKTFENRVNQLPSSDTGPKQLPTKRPEQKTSTPTAYQKENERSRKAPSAVKMNPARGQLGPTWKSVSSGSLGGVDERAGPSLKSQERSERRKEFFKKLEEKSNARVAERSQLSLKSKGVKDGELEKVKQKAKVQGGY